MHHFNYIRNENSEYYILINKTTEVTHSKRFGKRVGFQMDVH